jgi:hypothetical protein
VNFFNGAMHHIEPQRKDESGFVREAFGDLGHVPEGAPVAAPKLIGSDPTPADYAALEARWIDRGLAERAQLRRADSLTGAEIIGRKNGNYAGILIPYFHPGSDHVREYRLRRDQPDLEYDSAGNLKPRQKYLSPPGRSNMLYLAPGISPPFLRDPALPILITEGGSKRSLSGVWLIIGPRAGRGLFRWESRASTTGAAPSARRSDRTAAAWT